MKLRNFFLAGCLVSASLFSTAQTLSQTGTAMLKGPAQAVQVADMGSFTYIVYPKFVKKGATSTEIHTYPVKRNGTAYTGMKTPAPFTVEGSIQEFKLHTGNSRFLKIRTSQFFYIAHLKNNNWEVLIKDPNFAKSNYNIRFCETSKGFKLIYVDKATKKPIAKTFELERMARFKNNKNVSGQVREDFAGNIKSKPEDWFLGKDAIYYVGDYKSQVTDFSLLSDVRIVNKNKKGLPKAKDIDDLNTFHKSGNQRYLCVTQTTDECLGIYSSNSSLKRSWTALPKQSLMKSAFDKKHSPIFLAESMGQLHLVQKTEAGKLEVLSYDPAKSKWAKEKKVVDENVLVYTVDQEKGRIYYTVKGKVNQVKMVQIKR